MMKFNSKAKAILAAFGLLTVATVLIMFWPGKVLDPHDPRFDITKFRYEDYRHSKSQDEDVSEVFRVFFPQGFNWDSFDEFVLGKGIAVKMTQGPYGPQVQGLGYGITETISECKPDFYVAYRMTHEKPLIRLSGGGGAVLLVFYSNQNQVSCMVLNGRLIY